tara:strand:- start:892 stop:1467 length:576 start_codon:yes stop_codon:yes gene_type:complete
MKYEDFSEKSLIKKSQKGDSKAFEELVSRSNKYLYSWIINKTRNELEAEELLQITYIKCWKNIKKFRGKSNFKTWACSISRNLFIDQYRKKQKNKEYSLEEFPDAYTYQRVEFGDGFKNMRNEDLNILLKAILHKLPQKHREVLVSSAVEELSYKEMSKKFNCSIGTVMSRLYYARKKAQKLIKYENDTLQ